MGERGVGLNINTLGLDCLLFGHMEYIQPSLVVIGSLVVVPPAGWSSGTLHNIVWNEITFGNRNCCAVAAVVSRTGRIL